MKTVFFDIDNSGHTDLWVSDSKYNRLLRIEHQLGDPSIDGQANRAASVRFRHTARAPWR